MSYMLVRYNMFASITMCWAVSEIKYIYIYIFIEYLHTCNERYKSSILLTMICIDASSPHFCSFVFPSHFFFFYIDSWAY